MSTRSDAVGRGAPCHRVSTLNRLARKGIRGQPNSTRPQDGTIVESQVCDSTARSRQHYGSRAGPRGERSPHRSTRSGSHRPALVSANSHHPCGEPVARKSALGIRTIQRDQQTRQDAARAPIDGMQKSEGLGRDHVQGDVDYPQSPPVGGNHNPAWLNCGAYTNQVLPHPRSMRWNTALSGSPTARTCPTTKSPGSRTSPSRKATHWSRHPQTRTRRSSLALGDFSSTSRPPTTHAGDLPREVPPRPPDARTRCGVLRWT